MKLTEKEILLFDAIIKLYQTKPAVALSCINEENRKKFEYYCAKKASEGDVFYEFCKEFSRLNSD